MVYSIPVGRMSAITYDRLLPVTLRTFYIAYLSSRIHEEHTVDYYDRYRSQPMALYLQPVTAGDVIHGLHNYVYVHGLH